MCLHTVTKQITNPSATVVHAWKVFRLTYSRKYERKVLRYAFRQGGVATGKWRKARGGVIGTVGDSYNAGFHAYTTRRNAERRRYGRNVVAHVLLRKVRTKGWQDSKRVLVADEMLVPRTRKW